MTNAFTQNLRKCQEPEQIINYLMNYEKNQERSFQDTFVSPNQEGFKRLAQILGSSDKILKRQLKAAAEYLEGKKQAERFAELGIGQREIQRLLEIPYVHHQL
jgi:hypothetical protein